MTELNSAPASVEVAGARQFGEPALEAGVFLVDKPSGPSSFRMVQLVRRALGIKKVGHAGTLDPFASGLLIICAGRAATRLVPRLMGGDKRYEAVLRLGIATTTQDREGEVVIERPVPHVSQKELEACLAGFMGEQLQAPPAFSAVKHQGKPLYHYARKGIVVEKEPRPVVIHQLRLLERDQNTLRLLVDCSKGTYVRTLAADIGERLGCGGHLVELRRLGSGPFDVTAAVDGGLLVERETARQALLAKAMTVAEVEGLLPVPG
ncbi:MAG: tRNA pseudouridine(55) synthase TruB [Thermodesulfobacteriota bacterium]